MCFYPLGFSVFFSNTQYLHGNAPLVFVLLVYWNWDRWSCLPCWLACIQPLLPAFLFVSWNVTGTSFFHFYTFLRSFNCEAEWAEAAADWIAYPETWQVAALCCETERPAGTRVLVGSNDDQEVILPINAGTENINWLNFFTMMKISNCDPAEMIGI